MVNSWINFYNNFSSKLKSFLINCVTSEVVNIFGWNTLRGRLYPLTKKNSEAALKQTLSEIKKKTVENKSNFDPPKKIEEIKNIIKDIEGKKKEIEAFLQKLKSCYDEADPKKNQFFPIFKYYVEEYKEKFSDLNSLFEKYKTPFSDFIKEEKENYIETFFGVFQEGFCDIKEKLKNIPVAYNIDEFETYSNDVIKGALAVEGEGEISSVIKELKSLKNIFLETFVKIFVAEDVYMEKFKKYKIEEEEKEEEKEEKKEEEEKELNNGLKYKGFDIKSFIEGLFFSFFPNVEKTNESKFSKLDPKFFINKINTEKKLEKIAYNDAFFGLANEGQNCFLNALIQCLFKCSDIFLEIAEEKNSNDVKFLDFIETKKNSNDNVEANQATFIFDFLNLVKIVHTEKKKYEQVEVPSLGKNFEKFCEEVRNLSTNVKKEWRKVAGFPENTQQDAQQALQKLFECLEYFSVEFKNSYDLEKFCIDNDGNLFFYNGEGGKTNTGYSFSLENFDNEEYESTFYEQNSTSLNFLKKKMSTLYKNFGILKLERRACTSCGYVSCKLFVDNFRTYSYWSNIINNEQEEMSDSECESCRQKTKFTVFRRFFPLGKYFILYNVSLFKYLTDPGKNSKPQLPIYLQNFETKTKNIGKNKFKNVAVEMHSGSLNSGHYWAMVKSFYNNDYYFECNDSNDPYKMETLKYLPKGYNTDQQYLYFFEKIEEQNENPN